LALPEPEPPEPDPDPPDPLPDELLFLLGDCSSPLALAKLLAYSCPRAAACSAGENGKKIKLR